jgi:hypothetical protein
MSRQRAVPPGLPASPRTCFPLFETPGITKRSRRLIGLPANNACEGRGLACFGALFEDASYAVGTKRLALEKHDVVCGRGSHDVKVACAEVGIRADDRALTTTLASCIVRFVTR